jgi:hypothetical protein
MADTSAPVIKSSVTGSIRMTFALLIAVALAVFIYLWDSKIIHNDTLPHWLGTIVFFPLISVFLGYLTNCLIQYLSCKQVQWIDQLKNVAMIPIPQILIWAILNAFTNLRWPIEGLVQEWPQEQRTGLSSGFYGFWIALYTQSIMIGIAQLCPEL